MNNRITICTLLLSLGWMLLPVTGNTESLLEIYQQALQSDPLIHEAEARRLAANEATPEARGALFPQIDVTAGWSKSNTTGTNFFPDQSGNFAPFNTKNRTEQKQWQASLRQTLFRWDQFVQLKRADKIVAQAEVTREAAQQDLIVRVAQRYFDVLAAEDQLLAIHADKLAIARRLEQAKQRFDVGLIAITDVQESQAAFDQSSADEIGAKRTLATAREYLREITGDYVKDLKAPTDDFPLVDPNPTAEEKWIDLAMTQNLALVSSRLDEQLASDEVSFRRNGHYPTLDLVANVGGQDNNGERSLSGEPFVQSDSKGSNNSIGVQFTLPLFSGGTTSSRVQEAVYLHRASREQLQRVTRATERQTRDAYLGVLSEISRVKALKQTVASSRTALEATQAGFDVGTRTIVDVLNSQFNLYQAITNYYQSRYNYIINVLTLDQAAGTLQVQDLEQVDKWLKDRPPPEDVFAKEAAQTPAP